MDEEGYSLARRGLQTARKKYTNMTSLNLPTGKTAEDMNLAAVEPEEGVLVNENEIKPSTDSTVEKEKEEPRRSDPCPQETCQSEWKGIRREVARDKREGGGRMEAIDLARIL
jgi:hypothetical protein